MRMAGEATLLDAMNTGHDGTLTTIHASTTEGALLRLATLACRAPGNVGMVDALDEAKRTVDVVVQMARQSGQRVVSELCV